MNVARSLRVTWLGHGAERTGPPIYLLRVLEGLRDHPDIEPSVVLLDDGPLLDEFSALAPTVVIGSAALAGGRRLVAAGLSRAGATTPARAVVRSAGVLQDLAPPDVVVVNTAGSIRALDHLPWAVPCLVTHVHELRTGFEYWLGDADRQRILTDSDEIWVVADAVRDELIDRHGVDPHRIRTHRGVLPPGEATTMTEADRARFRRRLGVGADDILIGASGTMDWRKAPDLLLELLARAGRRSRNNLYLAWLGGGSASPWAAALVDGARCIGMSDRVHHLVEQDRPDRWFGALDLFVLPSREDAYPLVCLEAAAAGVPIVAFEGAGGTPELLASGGGRTAPYPDVAAMADHLAELANSPQTRVRLGVEARAAASRHTVEIAVAALVTDLHRVAGR